jgi:hypothetical protein
MFFARSCSRQPVTRSPPEITGVAPGRLRQMMGWALLPESAAVKTSGRLSRCTPSARETKTLPRATSLRARRCASASVFNGLAGVPAQVSLALLPVAATTRSKDLVVAPAWAGAAGRRAIPQAVAAKAAAMARI